MMKLFRNIFLKDNEKVFKIPEDYTEPKYLVRIYFQNKTVLYYRVHDYTIRTIHDYNDKDVRRGIHFKGTQITSLYLGIERKTCLGKPTPDWPEFIDLSEVIAVEVTPIVPTDPYDLTFES